MSGGDRQFYIQWKGYLPRDNTWEPESHLDECLDILQKYLRDKNLPLSKLIGLVGSSHSSSQEVNKLNWVTPHDILKVFNYFKNRYFK